MSSRREPLPLSPFDKRKREIQERFAAGCRAIEKHRKTVPLPELFLYSESFERREMGFEEICGFPIYEVPNSISLGYPRCPFCPVWKGENESIHDVLAAHFQSAYRNHTP